MAAEENTTPEEWRAVVGYEGHYEVSDHGRIRSMKSGPQRFGRILKLVRHSAGYLVFQASHNGGKQRPQYVHRAVLEAFDRPAKPDEQADHIDFDRSNNHISNLRWTTSLENNRHSWDAGRNPSGSATYNAKLTESDVDAIRSLLSNRVTQSAIASMFGVSTSAVSKIHRRQMWTR